MAIIAVVDKPRKNCESVSNNYRVGLERGHREAFPLHRVISVLEHVCLALGFRFELRERSSTVILQFKLKPDTQLLVL